MLFAEGKILKVSLESIHVVVLGFSAAVITDVDIREEFKYRMVCINDIRSLLSSFAPNLF